MLLTTMLYWQSNCQCWNIGARTAYNIFSVFERLIGLSIISQFKRLLTFFKKFEKQRVSALGHVTETGIRLALCHINKTNPENWTKHSQQKISYIGQ